MAGRRRSRDVLALLQEVATWEPFTGPTGMQLYRIPAGGGTGQYTVCEVSCTCPSDQYARRGQVCKHRQALALATSVHRALSKGEQGGVAPERQPTRTQTPPTGSERSTSIAGPRLAR